MAIRTLIGAAVSAGLFITASQALATNLIQNGGFEADNCATATTTFNTRNTLTNWTVAGNVDLICTYWQHKGGYKSIDLNGNVPATISQTFATNPGWLYQLDIGYSANPDNPNLGLRTANVDVYGSDLSTFQLSWDVPTVGNSLANMKWGNSSSDFVANDVNATLIIASTFAGAWGIALDDISVTVKGIPVDIDIKPGSDPNCFNINDKGIIPVAILGSEYVDVSKIDQSSLSFGGLEVRVRGKAPGCSYEDVNNDGYFDLVCKFVDDEAYWTPGDGTADLTGTLDGYPIYGTDDICVVPATK